MTAGTPPAGGALAQEAAGRLHVQQQRATVRSSRPAVSAAPAWRAMAVRCGCAFVEPPMAALTTMASRRPRG
jgi:hypothetical protein